MPPYRNYIYEYHAKITSGEIIAGKWIKKIYEIIINGLQKQEYFFNAKAANKAIRFIENFCHHSKGRNDLIKLELWQKAIVSVIFGIQDAEKIRIFREIFIVIGRKNGKSLFASAIIAYMAYLEPEYGQEIYCLRYREREAWRKTPYQITTLFKYHKEYNPHIFRQEQAGTPAATENMDDIDIALGGF